MNFDRQRGTRFGERRSSIKQSSRQLPNSGCRAEQSMPRSRIMRRLKEKVSQFEEEDGE